MTDGARPEDPAAWQRSFLERHQLPHSYLNAALKWFTPLVAAVAGHQKEAGRPWLIALNGCQGSGKTTLSDYLRCALIAEHGLHTLAMSIDDFYLTQAERRELALHRHPLLATRGVPGTHDLPLLRATLEQLLDPAHTASVPIPRFDKSVDDRSPAAEWDVCEDALDIVILEGWCLGAIAERAAVLDVPLNKLEREEDSGGEWRAYSNEVLACEYPSIYRLVDEWIMLCAPSFATVFGWRREQEQKLAASVSPAGGGALMDDAALGRFVQHYERITRHCLRDLPARVHHLFSLDERREIVAYRHQPDAEVPA